MDVLILGGTEFIGKGLVEKILEQKQDRIFLVNRGKKYWNRTP